MVETEDKGTLEASRMRGPKAPSMNNSNEERNEESTGNDSRNKYVMKKGMSRNPFLSGLMPANAGDLERSTVVERGQGNQVGRQVG